MNEELNKALEQISDSHIDEAASFQKRPFPWLRTIAAVLAILIAWTAVWGEFGFPATIITPTTTASTEPHLQTPTTPTVPTAPIGPIVVPLSGLVAEPVYPEQPSVQADQMLDIYKSLNSFFGASIQEFLSGEGNRAYSPVNVYMALSMLAQTSAGESRQQILDLLGAATIEELQAQTACVWNAHYLNSERTKLLLANSLWLDNSNLFDPDTVQILADNYYASVYAGDLGSGEMNEALRQWIDAQTDGLLTEHSQNLELDPTSVFALASIIYFKADWVQSFSESNTADGIFHSTEGDITVPFMHSSTTASAYYWGDDYTAVRLSLDHGNAMWLILPDEGKTPEDLLESGAYLSTVLPTASVENVAYPTIHLTMPKFDISAKSDLIPGIQNLGVTDIFSPQTADLSSLTDANAYVGTIEHAVRVAADENGVLGVAYTVIDAPNYGMPPEDEVDFVVDRPFLFMVTSRFGMPLFAGVVEQP